MRDRTVVQRVAAAVVLLMVLMVGGSTWMIAQGPPVTSVSLVSGIPATTINVGAAMTGYSGQGTTLYYWVVARYPGGLSVPQGPAVLVNTPGADNLNASQFVTISWNGVAGATGYDVIRGTTPNFPSPSCTACAVVLNTALLTATDNNAAPLGAYPPAGIPSAQSQVVTLQADSTNYSSTVVPVTVAGQQRWMPLLTSVPPAGQYPVFGANSTITSVASIPGTVPTTRQVATAAPLSGGGDLSADRTIACATCEVTTAKDAASGYAGLTAGTKLVVAQGQEVWAPADLTGVTGVIGNATTIQMGGSAAPVAGNCTEYDANGNVVDSGAPCAGGAPSDIILTGTYAALPAAATAGRVYFPTDSPYTHLRDTGAAWVHFRHGVQVTPPNDALFSWVNQETATVSTTSGAVVLLAPANAGQDDRLRVLAAPARPFTITMGMIVNILGHQYPGAGLVLRDAAGGDYVEMMLWNNSTPYLSLATWASPTNYAGTSDFNINNPYTSSEVWMRVVVTAGVGGTRTWYISRDGVNWTQVGTGAWDQYITTLDSIGFACQPQNANFPASITVFHWLVN